MGEPVDHANAFVYLASDEASWVTGLELNVDAAKLPKAALSKGLLLNVIGGKVLRIAQEPISLETPVGEEEESHLGDFIIDRDRLLIASLSSDSARHSPTY